MGKFAIKKPPKQFRFLFTLKEVKEIENFTEIKFKNVINGNLVNSKKFLNDQFIQSSIHGLSIRGTKSESGWDFTFYQHGFREELLPTIHESELKTILLEKIKEYLHKVSNSAETDCYNNPQLWMYIMIIENKAEVSWREIK